jgi:hypothetical protein
VALGIRWSGQTKGADKAAYRLSSFVRVTSGDQVAAVRAGKADQRQTADRVVLDFGPRSLCTKSLENDLFAIINLISE